MKEKYELAYQDYLNGMKYKEIASKYDVTINTVKSWKSRHWKNEKKVQKGCTQKNKVAHKKVATKIVKKIINEDEELDEERQLFCIYYLKYHNMVKAYQKVKPNSKYSSACVIASRWFKEERVQEEIKKLKTELLAEAMLDPCEIVQKYIDIAFYDATDYATFNGDTVMLNNSQQVDGTIIQEVKQGKSGVSIKFADRMKALDWLSKHMNMANDEQRAKIELMQAQAKATVSKLSNDEPDEIADDGFIDALTGTAQEDWSDYEE